MEENKQAKRSYRRNKPVTKSKVYAIRLDIDLVDFVREQPNMSKFINELIRRRRKIPKSMNEKSKAFELIEFVWNNEKTDSYLRVNIAMYEAVKLAIISQMKFNKEDFQNIFSKFSGGYWFGVNANGKGYGENFYRKAVTSGNISACQSYEAFCNIKPFIDSKGRRLCKGAMYRDNEKRYRVTGFDFSTKKVYLVGYAISDWEEKGKKTLFNFTNNEWNEFRKQIK